MKPQVSRSDARKTGNWFEPSIAHRTQNRPSLLHTLLAGLDCREVVTTNYDNLYERAVRATNRAVLSVMPMDHAHGSERWVLKPHGDINKPETIVLTRRSMVRYDAANRPSAAILQSLLLTKRLLIVGTSMTDDNVIRLAHEVDEYREHHQGTASKADQTLGTVLDVSGSKARERLWANQFDWINLADSGLWGGARAIELFLDRRRHRGRTPRGAVGDERRTRSVAARAPRLAGADRERPGAARCPDRP